MAKSVYWRDTAFPEDRLVSFENRIGFHVPTGTTAERPSNPTDGVIRFNTSIGSLEVYQDSNWYSLAISAVSGESNTASNIGGGAGVFKEKIGVDLVMRSIVAGTNISVTETTN